MTEIRGSSLYGVELSGEQTRILVQHSNACLYCTTGSPPQPKPSELTGPARIQQLIAYLTPAAGALPECSVRSSSCLHMVKGGEIGSFGGG